MNLALKYPIIFWNCANLITDTGGDNTEEIVDIFAPEYDDLTNGITYEDLPDKSGKIKKSASTDYRKIAIGLGKMIQSGISVEPPNVNSSLYTFYPDVKNNTIIFGLSGILNVGEEMINQIIANRPYDSPKDFLKKVNPKRPAMISLIKSGAFDSMMERRLCMGWYIWETCDKKSNITLQNMNSLIEYNFLPSMEEEKNKTAMDVYRFNKYLKTNCRKGSSKEVYKLDVSAIEFLAHIEQTSIISPRAEIRAKDWDKIYQGYMDIFRDYIATNKTRILDELNLLVFKKDWDKYASGTISAWEMEVLCFYYHEHELKDVDQSKYGFTDFFKLPEEPIVDWVFQRKGKEIPIYKLFKICGTCIAKNKAKSTATLLTTSGVVEVKFRKEYFALFDRVISRIGEDGAKHRVETSWFNRGQKLVVMGIRNGDNFVAKKYNSTAAHEHQLYRITKVNGSDIVVTHEREQGEAEDADD